MLICAIDFETTGLEPDKCFLTEVGCVVYDGETWEVKNEMSTLILEPQAIPLSNFIIGLTGITDSKLQSEGIPLAEALEYVKEISKDCVGFIAQNAGFDKSFMEAGLKRAGMDAETRPWYCSKDDVKQHNGKSCKKLSHLALDYGVQVDGSKLHRALDDAKLIGKMLKACGTTMTEIKQYAEDPWVYMQALCKGPWEDKGVSTNEAKKLGYSWERCSGTYLPVIPKTWVKRVKKSSFEEELKAVPTHFKRITIQVTPEDSRRITEVTSST